MNLPRDTQKHRSIEVIACGPMCTVQDRGRKGLRHLGISASGPLDRRLFHATVRAISHDGAWLENATAIELAHSDLTVKAHGDLEFSLDGAPMRKLQHGEIWHSGTISRAVRYLALRGGIEVPRVMHARATHVPAAFGGFDGRTLRKGDLIRIGHEQPPVAPKLSSLATYLVAGVLPIVPSEGPEGALAPMLAARVFTLSTTSNRAGIRLENNKILVPRALLEKRLSRGLLVGAVQVPPSGEPIVIGPDGPTTGGYPVAGVLTETAFEQLARARYGAEISFSLVPARQASAQRKG